MIKLLLENRNLIDQQGFGVKRSDQARSDPYCEIDATDLDTYVHIHGEISPQ